METNDARREIYELENKSMRELKNEYDVVILAAGDFPTNETAIHILRTAKHPDLHAMEL